MINLFKRNLFTFGHSPLINFTRLFTFSHIPLLSFIGCLSRSARLRCLETSSYAIATATRNRFTFYSNGGGVYSHSGNLFYIMHSQIDMRKYNIILNTLLFTYFFFPFFPPILDLSLPIIHPYSFHPLTHPGYFTLPLTRLTPPLLSLVLQRLIFLTFNSRQCKMNLMYL